VRGGEETRVVSELYEIIGETNAVSGDAVYHYNGQRMAGRESVNATLVAIPVILLILLLSTGSWFEPILYLASIGVAVLLNMGMGVISGEVSFITKSVAPILQLAVSLDYAIFLLNAFEKYRAESASPSEAMKKAMAAAVRSVSGSAATTLFGFLALCFMSFKIGPDLGLNLASGIVLSFVSVMVFLPAVTLMCYKLLDKSRHRPVIPALGRLGRVLAKIRIPALIITVILAVPSVLAASHMEFAYGAGGYVYGTRPYADAEKIDGAFGRSTPIVLLVPRGDTAREAALSDELETLPHVTGVVSYAETVGAAIPPEFLDRDLVSQFYSENYARIIVYTDTAAEGEAAFAAVEGVRSLAAKYYDTSYSCGESASLYDIRDTITRESRVVNALAIAAIALVLLVAFRSLSLPVILVLAIEVSVRINVSVSYFTGSTLFYVGYLIISTVQLGATVDYAILFADHYMGARRLLPPVDALLTTYRAALKSILISAATLTLAGLALWATSSNPITKTLGALLARGTVLSVLTVCCALPGALWGLDKIIRKTTLKGRF
ncbi:MAG: MMPL family transporter, partial [Oscillospiraceae bacterium]|jgi:predicted RND superfamily exporter protein|nr:MMPL family transporter [Oscillospiraceae bacterium]